MDKEELKKRILTDLSDIPVKISGIYLYGSWACGKADNRSDIDICLVAGDGEDPITMQSLAWRHAGSGIYDIRIFELLPLFLQTRILATGILLASPDPAALGEYLYGTGNDGMTRNGTRPRYQAYDNINKPSGIFSRFRRKILRIIKKVRNQLSSDFQAGELRPTHYFSCLINLSVICGTSPVKKS